MRTTEIRGSCPFCYGRMTAATDYFGEEFPMHGDIAICGRCGEAALFDFTKRKNTLRRPTAQEAFDIDKNTSAIRLRNHQAENAHGLQNRSHH